MDEYTSGYYYLFNAITKQIAKLEEVRPYVSRGDLIVFRKIDEMIDALKSAQCESEEMFIDAEDKTG